MPRTLGNGQIALSACVLLKLSLVPDLLPPEQDVDDRSIVWDCLQDLFMDTDVTLSYDWIVRVCSETKYSVDDIEEILFNEVLPGVRFNLLMMPAPEWRGFKIEWLKARVLSKHRFGRRRPFWFRSYAMSHWQVLKPRLEMG